MNVLILSSNNGAGHNSAGRAIAEALKARGVPCEMYDAISFRSPTVSEAIREIHIGSALHAKWLFQVGNKAASHRRRRQHSACYFLNAKLSPSICAYVREKGFDTVICTHVFPALAVSYAREHDHLNVRAYFVGTDYDCVPHIEETSLDGYFLPHSDLTAAFMKSGIPHGKLFATGIPVSERFSLQTDRTDARVLLNMAERGPVAMIMCGSMGFGRVKSLVARLLRKGPSDLGIVVLTGNNRELLDDLRGRYGETGRVHPLVYTDQVDLYMDACDVLFTKPGGLSVTEAAAKRIPLVLTDPIPGWEADNAAMFERLGMCLTGKKTKDYVDGALSLLTSERLRNAMLQAQRENVDPNAAARICGILARQSAKEAP